MPSEDEGDVVPEHAPVRVALVDDDTAVLVGHGRVLPLEQLRVSGAGPWAVLSEDGALLAVYESHRQGGKPTVVIPR